MDYVIEKLPTKTFGLKYVPLLMNYGMEEDAPPGFLPSHKQVGPIGFKELDRQVLQEEVLRLGDRLQFALEIGVTTSVLRGSSCAILDNKPKDAVYLGIDRTDQSWVETSYPNAHFLRTVSADTTTVQAKMADLGFTKIDLLFIDGWHSVTMVLIEWGYVDMLSPYGTVVIHDVSVHPGPRLLFEAIDEELFDKQIFDDDSVWGIGVARRKASA